jgi:group I intron endonuclease
MVVYVIFNCVNGKIYVGKTSASLESRWKNHIFDAFKAKSQCPIHRAMRKHGLAAFSIFRISDAISEIDLNAQEVFYIQKFNSTDSKRGYNLTLGGDGGWDFVNRVLRPNLPPPMLGKHHSTEARQRMSNSHRGKVLSNETRDRLSKAHKTSELMKANLRAINAAKPGKPLSEETKRNMGMGHRTRWASYSSEERTKIRRHISEGRRRQLQSMGD